MTVEVALSEADINRIAEVVAQRLKARETGDGKRMFTVGALACRRRRPKHSKSAGLNRKARPASGE